MTPTSAYIILFFWITEFTSSYSVNTFLIKPVLEDRSRVAHFVISRNQT